MRDLLLLAVQLVVTFARLMCPGGVRAVIAESLLLKHQLLISRRSRERAPPLTTVDRFVLGLTMLFVSPRRVAKLAAILKPATLLRFHRALVSGNIWTPPVLQERLGFRSQDRTAQIYPASLCVRRRGP